MRVKQSNLKKVPYLVGVTGSFGTGKSLVGNLLKEEGIFVIDTDDIVQNILKTRNKTTQKIVAEFGKSIINNSAGYISRKKLGAVVFRNKLKRKKLELIIHPEVNRVLVRVISKNKKGGIIAVLIPLLFECGYENFFHEIWCVICKGKVQLQRLQKKGFTLSEAKARIEAQLPIKVKARKVDFVIDNSNDIKSTKKQVEKRFKQLVRLNHNHHLFCGK